MQSPSGLVPLNGPQAHRKHQGDLFAGDERAIGDLHGLKVGIVGSRRRSDRDAVCAVVAELPETATVVSGGCRGVDVWAATAARDRGLEVIEFRPDLAGLRQYGEICAEYSRRNRAIAETCDVLIAFPAPDRRGGTEQTIRFTERLGKMVIIR